MSISLGQIITEYHQDGFLWHLYGFYDATNCYLCNNTYISINI